MVVKQPRGGTPTRSPDGGDPALAAFFRQNFPEAARLCRDCGKPFEQWLENAKRQGSALIRCNPCYRKMVTSRPSYRAKFQQRTAAKDPGRSGAAYRRLRAQVLAEETVCGFCGELVDTALPYKDRMAATIDHIVPLALGGEPLERSNVRLAHRSCNASAGNRVKADVERERLAFARAALWLADRL